MSERKRYSHIDLLETLAIFFVLIYHCTLYSYDFAAEGTAVNYLRYFSRTILSTCVPLFFFANGYLLFHRPFQMKKHIRRTLRIVILVIIWGFLLVPIYMSIAGEPISVKETVRAILNMDTKWAMNHFWFFCTLVSIYILFPALKTLFDKDRRSLWLIAAACFVFTFGFVLVNEMLALGSVLTHRWLGTINYFFIVTLSPFRGQFDYALVYFCAGGLICTYEDQILAIPAGKRNTLSILGILISCGLLFATGILYTGMGDELWDVVWNGYDTVFTLCNVIFLFILSLNYSKDFWIIREISCNTLGIFFTHETILRLTRSALRAVPALCNVPISVLYSFTVLCVCLAICLLLRRIPVLKRLVC
ncbi:MAG: acyltransferase [Oscillospiraceae bacterium]|nr:acyltransferase [Oscillospiraceae bacterium]